MNSESVISSLIVKNSGRQGTFSHIATVQSRERGGKECFEKRYQ